MAAASTPELAARSWWEQHGDRFGIPDLDLRPTGLRRLGRVTGRTVFGYRQFLDGLPVEGGSARVLVRDGLESTVVYVGAKLASLPVGGFEVDTIDGGAARAIVRTVAPYDTLPDWSEPELTIFHGPENDGPGPAVRAWRFRGGDRSPSARREFTFFVDAATAELVYVRDDVLHSSRVNVTGHVGGNGSPGVLPDVPHNPAVELDVPGIEVHIVEGSASFTDRDGDFELAHGGVVPVTVETAVTAGRWVGVRSADGADLEAQVQVTPPGPADLLLNETPSEFTTSQVNAFVQVTHSHDFFKDRQPEFEGLDLPLTVWVNNLGSCNALFVGLEIFCKRAGTYDGYTCPNSCYSTIVGHEYGHFVHTVHGIGGGSFAEGYADAYSLLQFDTPIMGAEFFEPGLSVRDYSEACPDYRYPCSEALPACGTEGIEHFPEHGCAKLLGGIWWKIKRNAQAWLGPQSGLEYARQLFTDWTGITLGGDGLNSATPQTIIEVLTVDDDNGDLGDATPHAALICASFAAHGLDCPAFGAGEVPDGSAVPGPQLVVGRVPAGRTDAGLELFWGPSCLTGDADYAVYEGAIGDFASHEPILCSTTGATTASITPGDGDRYYLVVPSSPSREGSYGTDGRGQQRPAGSPACREQLIEGCPRAARPATGSSRRSSL